MKDCNQCGKCCIKYSEGGLTATAEEISDWEIFAPNIYEYVRDGEIWIDPETGKLLKRCPWLRQEVGSQKYTCDIYHDRPADCRYYPVTIAQMVQDECEMLEVSDLKKIEKAQTDLDFIMRDSRPGKS